MTSKKISQRLKDVGFDCFWDRYWVYNKPTASELIDLPDNDGWTCEGLEYGHWNKDLVYLPQYNTERLFKWLRENVGKVKKYPYSYSFDDEDGFTVDHLIYGDSNDPNNNYDSPAFPFKTSLADILGEAIIWILEQK